IQSAEDPSSPSHTVTFKIPYDNQFITYPITFPYISFVIQVGHDSSEPLDITSPITIDGLSEATFLLNTVPLLLGFKTPVPLVVLDGSQISKINVGPSGAPRPA